jgi:hypothetical protein
MREVVAMALAAAGMLAVYAVVLFIIGAILVLTGWWTV